MDKIYVSESALNTAINILTDLQEETNIAYVNLEQTLSECTGELEYNFKTVVDDFIGVLGEYNSTLSSCLENNISAISERQGRLNNYEKYPYKKINMN